ncbi:hypothetical protein [Prochlorococcus marinus]|uniref:hypothetical protein n=1 Tax=Prochlorococcus marinus TaxID=1219 RepID=UPI0022B4993E|nr:hypothetical protein [Prochlorococcus marinus]
MTKPFIYTLIKTDCGRAKYQEIASRKTFNSKLRLLWFIVIATIKDLTLKNQKEEN